MNENAMTATHPMSIDVTVHEADDGRRSTPIRPAASRIWAGLAEAAPGAADAAFRAVHGSRRDGSRLRVSAREIAWPAPSRWVAHPFMMR